MKGLILYLSGTGNTKYIANVIKKEFELNNNDIDVYSIEKINDINTELYDFLVIGNPVYFMYTPFFLLDSISKRLKPALKETKIILFATMAGPTKSDFRELIAILYDKNYDVVSTKTFRMPNNYFLDEGKMHKPTDKNLSIKNIGRSTSNAKVLVNDFINGKYKKEMCATFFGLIFKNLAYKNKDLHKEQGKRFTTNGNCTKCMICINNCPVTNIEINNSKVHFSDKCILCTKCINSCPSNAILYDGMIKPQYNLNI